MGTWCRVRLPGVCGSNQAGVCSHWIVLNPRCLVPMTYRPGSKGVKETINSDQIPSSMCRNITSTMLHCCLQTFTLRSFSRPSSNCLMLQQNIKNLAFSLQRIFCHFSAQQFLCFLCMSCLVLCPHQTSMKITSDQTSSDGRWEYQEIPAGVS